MMRVLIGGVGYRNLRDHSFCVMLVDSLAAQAWPPGVSIEDVSYNPIAVVQRLEDDPEDARFDLAIIIGALQRPGRIPGTLSVYRWDNVLPSDDGVHEAITEAVTGIISLDNTLVVARYFKALPATVVALESARSVVTLLARQPATAERIPEGALAAERARHTGVVFGQVMHGVSRIH
jgi:hypothetical protein